MRLIRQFLPELLGIVTIAIILLWINTLQTENEYLEEQLEKNLKYQEELDKKIQDLNNSYELSIKEVDTLAKNRSDLTKEINSVKHKLKDKNNSYILYDTSEYILKELRRKGETI